LPNAPLLHSLTASESASAGTHSPRPPVPRRA